MGPVVQFLNRLLYYPVVIIFVFNLIQRWHMDRGRGKRFATLYMGGLILAFWGITFFFQRFRIPDGYLIVPAAASAVLLIVQRRRFFPFRIRCSDCGRRLSLRAVLFDDANLCGSCSGAEPSRNGDAE